MDHIFRRFVTKCAYETDAYLRLETTILVEFFLTRRFQPVNTRRKFEAGTDLTRRVVRPKPYIGSLAVGASREKVTSSLGVESRSASNAVGGDTRPRASTPPRKLVRSIN